MNNKFEYGSLWAEVNLDNLEDNIRAIRDRVRDETLLMGVIKANAYGHGAIKYAQVLLENGVDKLAVATIREAIELRQAGIEADILVLGYTQDLDLGLVLDYNITQTIFNIDQARILSRLAVENKSLIKIHIKLDTGMGRIGYRNIEDVDEILEISRLDGLEIEGIFTHFATADSLDKSFTRKQYEKFKEVVDKIEEKGLNISIKHVSNSAAIIDLPEYNLDMVRAGIILYGLYPSDEVEKDNLKLKPVMTLKTKLSHIKSLDPGVGIGYGQTYTTKQASKIATMPVGYADGFSRLLSNVGQVGVNGSRADIVGRVCMDQTMIDISGIEAEVEDEVVIFNDGSNGYPTIEEMAKHIGTINYEIATLIGRRIPRVYISKGEIIDIVDYVLS